MTVGIVGLGLIGGSLAKAYKNDDIEGMKQLLLKLNFIREDLGLQARAKSRDYRSE